ncbi:inositol monophosphatase [Chitiniphilus purpureus]|uniref:Inositol-1-monophosphatase n=1 Tax=Chitiniphilus purpureus TaxID=2981137 RepID=A0ABY6DIF4_9NEIS|nr:inositol monophosphatase family protein [Chitiniphilus sp. CD1]UXY14129.1 inositol monophosphatase [Chitiniphilus sp. CD1]
MHPMLNTAVRAARRAASVIQRASNNLDLITPEKKGHNDFVSEVDRAAESAIIETILEAYPKHAILAEESGSRGDSEYCWIIDPLDGTTNFLHGFPQYAISIALEHKGVITQAVVYDPNRNDLFTATRGVGAFLNDRRIRVSKVRDLSDALIGTGFPYTKFNNLETYLAIFRDMAQQAAGVRRPGAAALDLAYVACGRFDGFFEFDLKVHDIAAGILLVQEAGGLVTDLAGEEHYLQSGDVLCGTPRVFGQMLHLIKQHMN